MQVVHVDDAGQAAQLLSYVGELEALRKTLEQDIQRILDDSPGGPDDAQANENGKHRIDDQPAGEANGDSADDDSCRARGVAQHVNPRGADIQIAARVISSAAVFR